MPLDESVARRILRRNLATNVSKKFTRFRRNDVLQRMQSCLPHRPCGRPRAGLRRKRGALPRNGAHCSTRAGAGASAKIRRGGARASACATLPGWKAAADAAAA